MAAIPIVKFDSGLSEVLRGSLFDCPTEFFALAQIQFYQSCKAGWSRCPLGYSTYSALDAMGRKLVVPGVLEPGSASPNRRFPNYPIRFSRSQIEDFLKPHLGLSEEVKSQRDREFKNLTHDLRAISTEIYHTALRTKEELESGFGSDAPRALEDILAAQQMMSLRLDIVDYESGHSAGRPKESISVFRKVDKVLRCFKNRMEFRSIHYSIDGHSYGFTFGPPIFEIIPFVIIENAVKYAPNGSEITVRFEESVEQIIVRFESLGPKIKESEKDKVFEQHFRGEAAQNSERGGSGIGLYAARTLLESQFGGKIFVNQLDGSLWYDGNMLHSTRFTVILPRRDPVGQTAIPRVRRTFRPR